MTWHKLREEPYGKGHRKLLRKVFRLPDGSIREFDIKLEEPSVSVLAITADTNVLLARQFRPGPERVLLELPGGNVDLGETPQDAALRELLEETGYAAGTLQYLGHCLDCAYSTRIKHSFVATACTRVSQVSLEDREFIHVVQVSLEEFRIHLRSGDLTDTETGYRGLEFLGLL